LISEILNNKIIIIAGGCGKIGKSFVNGVYEHGGIPIIGDIDEQKAKGIIEHNRSDYNTGRGDYYRLDILNKKSISELINYTKKKYGKIDVFTNVVYPPIKPGDHSIENMELSLFNNGIKSHLGAYFLSSQQFIIYFKKQGYGNIINVSSIQGNANPKFDTYVGAEINSVPMNSPIEYSCIKAAINSMTTYLAKYLKDTNIRCNIISPGGIKNDQPEIFIQKYKKYCSSKGLLSGEDIKGAFLFLASDLSKFINGQNIIVDDGWSL
jgi:NAD(P)-dependent dehydrogenase (short-subunit alcohol dehydrogenase family)